MKDKQQDIIDRLKKAARVDYGALLDAIEEINRLRDREKKYESALEMACESLKENDICPVKCCKEAEPYGESCEPQCYGDCCTAERFIDYFKKQAGLEGVAMNDPTAQRAVTNIMRRRKAEHRAKSQRRRQGDKLARAAKGMSV